MTGKKKPVPKEELVNIVKQHGEAEAARLLGITKQAVNKRMQSPERRDSVEALRHQRTRKVKADADRAELLLARTKGALIPMENVNALLLLHAGCLNTALRHLRHAGMEDAAAIVLDAYTRFGDSYEGILLKPLESKP